MGQITSRSRSRQEEDERTARHSYSYPAVCGGSYFGTHFLFAGERYPIAAPEAYLFGDNNDLNFLASKPMQLNYPHCSTNEAVRPIYCAVAIRRDSLKFVRVPVVNNTDPSAPPVPSKYNIDFLFDTDHPCTIRIIYFSVERLDNMHGLNYLTSCSELTSSYHFKPGAGQRFNQPDHIFEPSVYNTDDLLYNPSTEVIPVVIQCVVESTDNSSVESQSHVIHAYVEKASDGQGFVLKTLKQKHFVDGVLYLMQEIYGIENKRYALPGETDGTLADSFETNGECIVCMSEYRDTLILPCRHLCVCSSCAETLRYKANCCPVCRSPFRALLQIEAVQQTYRRSNAKPPTQNDKSSSCSSVVSTLNSDHPVGFFNNAAAAGGGGAALATGSRYSIVPLVVALNGASYADLCSGRSLSSRRSLPIPAASSCGHGCTAVATTVAHHSSSQPVILGGGGSTSYHRSGRTSSGGARRHHRRKKIPKPPAPIQEVLTPQALVAHNKNGGEMIEMPVRRITVNRSQESFTNQTAHSSTSSHHGPSVVQVQGVMVDFDGVKPMTVTQKNLLSEPKPRPETSRLPTIVDEESPSSSANNNQYNTPTFLSVNNELEGEEEENDDDDDSLAPATASEDEERENGGRSDGAKTSGAKNDPRLDGTATSSSSTASSASNKPLLTTHATIDV